MSRRVAKSAAGARKRLRKANDADEVVGFSLLDDEDATRQPASEEDEEQHETAEQKRIRLARAYLDELKAAAEADADDGQELHGDDFNAAKSAAQGDDMLADKLRLDALETHGRLQRHIAHHLLLPPLQQQLAAEGAAAAIAGRLAADTASSSSSARASLYGTGRFVKAHRLSPTALALTSDEQKMYSVSKDGLILKWDVETMQRVQVFRPGSKAAKAAAAAAAGTTADWVAKGPRQSPTSSLLAAAVSSDGKFLAVAGGDQLVHVFDAPSGEHIRSYPGHREQVSSLAFRDGAHTLYSAAYDRTIKIWSLDDAAYVDTLFGHQAEVLAIDAARTERVVSVGHDHTCRIWKIPEESHLVFRSPSMAQQAVVYITGSEWVSGGCDGSLQVWNTLKKKPVSVTHHAHGSQLLSCAVEVATADQPPPQHGSWATANVDTSCWLQSVATSKGSDLVASGAGDGFIRLWAVEPSKHGGAGKLLPVGQLPAAGFVNGLALGKSGRVCVAALGQEPRLGRWGRLAHARNGLLVHRWELADDVHCT